jgi:hypothetical protein
MWLTRRPHPLALSCREDKPVPRAAVSGGSPGVSKFPGVHRLAGNE